MNFYVGCPIWSWKGWVGNFYPEGTKPSEFLHEYTQRLTTVEGNTTFYAAPAPKTLEGWAEEMPATFRFCPKVPKAISHEGKLVDNVERAQEFIDLISTQRAFQANTRVITASDALLSDLINVIR